MYSTTVIIYYSSICKIINFIEILNGMVKLVYYNIMIHIYLLKLKY